MAAAATLAAVLHRVGSWSRAARLYQEVIIELTASDGPESLRVLAAHADLATVEYARGQCQVARDRLQDAWELHREVYGDGHPSGIKMLARLGSMQRDCDQFAEAQDNLALARELARQHLAADDPLAIQVAALSRAAANPDHVCADNPPVSAEEPVVPSARTPPTEDIPPASTWPHPRLPDDDGSAWTASAPTEADTTPAGTAADTWAEHESGSAAPPRDTWPPAWATAPEDEPPDEPTWSAAAPPWGSDEPAPAVGEDHPAEGYHPSHGYPTADSAPPGAASAVPTPRQPVDGPAGLRRVEPERPGPPSRLLPVPVRRTAAAPEPADRPNRLVLIVAAGVAVVLLGARHRRRCSPGLARCRADRSVAARQPGQCDVAVDVPGRGGGAGDRLGRSERSAAESVRGSARRQRQLRGLRAQPQSRLLLHRRRGLVHRHRRPLRRGLHRASLTGGTRYLWQFRHKKERLQKAVLNANSSQSGDGLSRHSGGSPSDDEIGREQEYVSMLYQRLDDLRDQAATRLTEQLRSTGGTLQARSQRDSSVRMYADQVEQFSAVENGLCFGRLDTDSDQRHYIGRIGIFDTEGDYEPLLMDWRAPAARAFYLATAANPQGIRRRRHLRTRQRKVVGLNDEVLDLTAASPAAHEELTGEASLLAAVNAGRTGRMRDIVETIQAEQDRIIRADLSGVLVVQGGPGTGKTAVALHRAAYLLYTHRRELSSRGVLLVGPNVTFLRYISQVLPALAETGVLLRTQGDLFPGITAHRAEPATTAALKGRLTMVEVLTNAVRDRQRVPDEPAEIELPQREVLVLDPATVWAARDRARRSGRPHNLARAVFDIEVIHALADQVAERIGADPLGGENLLEEADRAEIRRELREDPEVRAALDELWPVLTPQRLLADLYAAPERIDTAAPMLSDGPSGRRRTCPCSTRRRSCSARTTGPPPPAGTGSVPCNASTPRACWRSPGVRARSTWRTRPRGARSSA